MGYVIAGACAGAVTGLLGAGGGLVLVPLLAALTDLKETELFPASLAVITAVCLVCLALGGPLPWAEALPYLPGSALGGLAAGLWGRKIPAKWLHRGLGILILWGGWRYLWNG